MRQEPKRILVEALVVSMMGLALGLGANLVSPRGLSLTRNYFPGAGKTNSGGGVPQGTNQTGAAAWEATAARLKEKGLQPIDAKEAIELFRAPEYEQELIVFIDARDDRHYQEGHIPGAYQFDRYYPEKHLPSVLPACLNATKVVVYCAGISIVDSVVRNCEDSEFAALALRDAGVGQDRLLVYVGGMNEWATNGPSVEIGGRKSGNLRGAKQ